MKQITMSLKALAAALPLALAAAGAMTLTTGIATAPPAKAFGLGDVWDTAKDIGSGAVDAGRSLGSNAERIGKEIGGEAKDIGSGAVDAAKSLGSNAKRIGKEVGSEAADIGRGAGDAGKYLGKNYLKWAKKSPIPLGNDFEPKPTPVPESSPYKPGEWGGNAVPLDSLGPTKSTVIADERERADKARTARAIWKNAGKAVRQQAERNKAGTQSAKRATTVSPVSKALDKAVTKGTDTGNPYPGYPGRSKPDRSYPDYPKKPGQASKPGKGPAMKANVARDRSAAGRPIGNAKDTVARDRSAMGRPIGKLKDRVPRDRSALGRKLGKGKTLNLKPRRKLNKVSDGFTAKGKKRFSVKGSGKSRRKLRKLRKLDANAKVFKQRKLRKSFRAGRKDRRRRDDS